MGCFVCLLACFLAVLCRSLVPLPGIKPVPSASGAVLITGLPGKQPSMGFYFFITSDSKASACSAGDPGSIPGSGRSPGEGTSTPLQYSCLENPMDGGTWQATVHGVTESQTRLSDFTGKSNIHSHQLWQCLSIAYLELPFFLQNLLIFHLLFITFHIVCNANCL